MKDARTLFKSGSLDDFVNGGTNVPLALHNGAISEGALAKIWQQVEGMTNYRLTHPYKAVLRVEKAFGTVDYVAARFGFGDVGNILNRATDYNHCQFTTYGRFLSHQSGHKFNDLDALLTMFTAGLYLATRLLPSVKSNATLHDKLSILFTNLVNSNKRDALKFADPVLVHLGGAQEVQTLTGRGVKPVPLPTFEQYVSGGSQTAVQIAARLFGAGAVINYQQGSPAKGTPVILE